MEYTYENFKKYIKITTYECDGVCSKCPYKKFRIDNQCFGAFENFNVFLLDIGLLMEYIARYAKESYDKGFQDGLEFE